MPPTPSSVVSSYGPSRVPFGKVICGEARSIAACPPWHPACSVSRVRTPRALVLAAREKGLDHADGLVAEALRRPLEGPAQRRAPDHPGAAEDDQGGRGRGAQRRARGAP